jgi:hypothetical protein
MIASAIQMNPLAFPQAEYKAVVERIAQRALEYLASLARAAA